MKYRLAGLLDTGAREVRSRPRVGSWDSPSAPSGFPSTLILASILIVGALAVTAWILGLTPSLSVPGSSDYPISYSGRIVEDGKGVTDKCNMKFSLYDRRYGGHQLGETISKDLALEIGKFSALLDFGLDVEKRNPYVEVQAQCPSGVGEHRPIVRQRLNRRKPLELNSLRNLVNNTFGDERSLSTSRSNRLEMIARSIASSPLAYYYDDDPRLYEWDSAPQWWDTFDGTTGRGIKAVAKRPGHQQLKRFVNLVEPPKPPNSHGLRRTNGEKGTGGIRYNKSNHKKNRENRPSGNQSTATFATSITH